MGTTVPATQAKDVAMVGAVMQEPVENVVLEDVPVQQDKNVVMKDVETLLYASRMVLTLKYINVKLQNLAASVLPVVTH